MSDQRWTLGRIKTLIGGLFHAGYTVEGTGKPMRRHGWSAQVPVRQSMARDDAAVAVWTDGRFCVLAVAAATGFLRH